MNNTSKKFIIPCIRTKQIADSIKAKGNGRKVAFWGCNYKLYDEFAAAGINISAIFTSNETILKENLHNNCLKSAYMKNKSDEYFVILVQWIAGQTEWQQQIMKDFGYTENDWIAYFPKNELKMVGPTTLYDEVTDNSVNNPNKNVNIKIHGFSNSVDIEQCYLVEKLNINIVGNNNHIKIGKDCKFLTENNISFSGDNSTINMGDQIRMKETGIKVMDGSLLSIGNKTTFEADTKIISHNHGKIIFGEDCMCSFDNIFMAGDGHTIYDMNTGKNINSYTFDNDGFLYELVFGDHVWIGRRCMLLGGRTSVASGCIIGAQSVIKGKHNTENAAIAGSPAKIVRQNISWTRQNMAPDLF